MAFYPLVAHSSHQFYSDRNLSHPRIQKPFHILVYETCNLIDQQSHNYVLHTFGISLSGFEYHCDWKKSSGLLEFHSGNGTSALLRSDSSPTISHRFGPNILHCVLETFKTTQLISIISIPSIHEYKCPSTNLYSSVKICEITIGKVFMFVTQLCIWIFVYCHIWNECSIKRHNLRHRLWLRSHVYMGKHIQTYIDVFD